MAQTLMILIFVIIGQSNASGWAGFPVAPLIPDNVTVFGNDYLYHPLTSDYPIDSPVNQVDIISLDDKAGYGFPAAFAERVVEMTGAKVVLIPCAKGGSGIKQWQSDQPLYESCLRRIQIVTTDYGIPLTGVLYNQGERDARKPWDALNWAVRFETFVGDLRASLGYDVPVLYAQLGEQYPDDYPCWGIVRNQQAAVNIPMGTMVSVDDITGTTIHYTTWQTTLIGYRYAYWWLELYQ